MEATSCSADLPARCAWILGEQVGQHADGGADDRHREEGEAPALNAEGRRAACVPPWPAQVLQETSSSPGADRACSICPPCVAVCQRKHVQAWSTGSAHAAVQLSAFS